LRYASALRVGLGVVLVAGGRAARGVDKIGADVIGELVPYRAHGCSPRSELFVGQLEDRRSTALSKIGETASFEVSFSETIANTAFLVSSYALVKDQRARVGKDVELASLESVDDRTARIKLKHPYTDTTPPQLGISPRVTDLAGNAVAALDPLAGQADTTITIDAPGPVQARAGQRETERMIANLLSNAIRHAPPGSQVRVVIADDPPMPSVEVIDEGTSHLTEADRAAIANYLQSLPPVVNQVSDEAEEDDEESSDF